jgi:hypothetical protein|tara:strand:+ start:1320 stop:1451 length:132 start_codon:yes stop_codon:yes gene_type:complete
MNFVGIALTSTDENLRTGYTGEIMIEPPVLVVVAGLQNVGEGI